MNRIFLALGSNLGNRKKNLKLALRLLERSGIKIKRSSQIHQTEPVGFRFQPRFLNMVVEGETEKRPEAILSLILEIERKMGRIRVFKNCPRTIDIDILFFNGEVIDRDGLKIPHPEIENREFILRPLAEIAPDFLHPQSQKSIRELLTAWQKRKADGRKGIELYCD